MRFLKSFILIISFSIILFSCSNFLIEKNMPLSGIWYQTELSPVCKNLVDSQVKFSEIICGSWHKLNFYLKKYFHVQSLNFKYAGEKTFLFDAKGEIAGGACFVGISANVFGNTVYVHGDETTQKANAVVFQISAIAVESNKETKSYCSVKYSQSKKKWCALGVREELSEIKKWTKSNPECPN